MLLGSVTVVFELLILWRIAALGPGEEQLGQEEQPEPLCGSYIEGMG